MMHQRNFLAPRRGFTLTEILVVIAIITILAALGSWGVFAMIGIRQANNTKSTLRTLDKLLQSQWSGIIAKAQKEAPSPAAVMLAGGSTLDPQGKRAKVIWTKIRLKEAFPMSYAEVMPPLWNNLQSYSFGNNVRFSDGLIYTCITIPPGTSTGQPPPSTPGAWLNFIPAGRQKPHFTKYKATLATAGPAGANESSVCLLMAMRTLLQTEGIDLDDQLAYAVGIADAGNNLNGLMDGWGKPLGFTRFGSNLTFPVTNPAAAGAAAAKFADGVDNEGTLIHPVWYWFPTPTAPTFRGVFESQFHKIAIEPAVVPPAPPPAPAAAYYVLPVIGSAGKDGNFGTQADNIYNFQLRGE